MYNNLQSAHASHLRCFRMAAHNDNVDVLNVVYDVAGGGVDIIIGTKPFVMKKKMGCGVIFVPIFDGELCALNK